MYRVFFRGDRFPLGSQYRQRCSRRSAATLDEAAAEHAIAIVEHQRLPRRDRRNGLLERELDLTVIEPHDVRGRRVRAMPNLDLHGRTNRKCIDEPIHLAGYDTTSEQRIARADDHS